MRKRAFFFGFSGWKHLYIKPFFTEFDSLLLINPIFGTHLDLAIKRGLKDSDTIFIWGKREFSGVEKYAIEHNIPIFRAEDGFLRSVSLGSDLTRPFSLVIDSKGIYFDPTQESDLEYILNNYTFDQTLLQRARYIKEYLLQNRLSKYNCYQDTRIDLPGIKPHQEVILVPGQVEDDASIIYGGNNMSNLELLQRTRQESPNGYIIFKPHPDVLAGNRKGAVLPHEALKYCDQIIEEASLDSVLDRCDSVHTITSLVGFEALLRGKSVTTYGMPFYAGWGLTTDHRLCNRRKRSLHLDELVAAAYILYPKYIHPHTKQPCEVEDVIQAIDKLRTRYNTDRLYRYTVNMRHFIIRKLQLIIKVMLGE